MPETMEIPLKGLRNWLEEEASSIIEPIRAEGMSLLNTIRNKLEELRDSSGKLLENSEKEMLKSSPKTYRRARTAYKFARDTLETIDVLDIPDSITHEILQTLCEDLEKTLSGIGRERAKRFRQITPYFILDRRRFDVALKKALDSSNELRGFSSDGYAQAKDFEDSLVVIEKLLKSLQELEEAKKRKSQAQSRKEVIEEKIDEVQRRVASIRSRGEVSELSQLDDEIQQLETALKRDLRHLEKPFRKFQKLVHGPGYRLPLDETRKLSQYISSPFEALAAEAKGHPQLRKILQAMEDAVAKGKLKLKRSRLGKAKEQINEILNKSSLLSLHENCSNAFSRRQELSASKAVAVSKGRQAKLEETLDELQKRKKLAESRMLALERRYEAELENIETQKKELENLVLEITGESMKVTL